VLSEEAIKGLAAHYASRKPRAVVIIPRTFKLAPAKTQPMETDHE
jgi:hypothetical protein